MNRPISTRTHGAIDYAWTTTAVTLTRLLGGASGTARLVRGAAAAAGFNSMVTDYEAGLLKMAPMRTHLAFDFALCTVLMISPLFLPRAERRYMMVPVALGAVGLLASMLTETVSPGESGSFTPSRELSEAVADPDVAGEPYLRAHSG